MKNRNQQLLNDSALLDLRIRYLVKFIRSRVFNKLPDSEKGLFESQLYSMKTLSSILKMRVDIVNDGK
ncbi:MULTISPECIES: crAss001_48 related protein [unclassified Providencia]|uniref:crAss001_48 related protein n=1 Tax=unclassified Providencia TaxID=2633465 RepID=UPI003FA6F6CF